ncbi:hypothetical protein QTP86_003646 [Hemibagrus guttatus]|nr:hypothetical protein QTP86_003646 [Hemibagrus guttatus]
MTIVPMLKKSTVSCLNDYRPIALTPIMMKCFERLVMRYIKTQLPPSLDPMKFAYRPNCYTDDAITTTLHLALTHLDNKDTYHLIKKLSLLGLNTSLCNWILDFLTGRPQSVRIGNSISNKNVNVHDRGAVRKNQSSTNAADSERDSYAIRWFSLAPDRGGGRKERSRAKEALTEMPHGN